MYQFRQTNNSFSGFFVQKIFWGCNSKNIVQLLVVNQVFEFAIIIIWGRTCPFIARPGVKRINEPQREKTYLLTCALKEDSDQPAHPRSLIRVFVVRMMKLCILGCPNCAQSRFLSDCPGGKCQKVHFLTLWLLCIR